MTAFQFVGASVNNSAGSSLPLPAGTQPDDLLVLCISGLTWSSADPRLHQLRSDRSIYIGRADASPADVSFSTTGGFGGSTFAYSALVALRGVVDLLESANVIGDSPGTGAQVATVPVPGRPAKEPGKLAAITVLQTADLAFVDSSFGPAPDSWLVRAYPSGVRRDCVIATWVEETPVDPIPTSTWTITGGTDAVWASTCIPMWVSAVPPVTRQWPRDDGLGISSGVRRFPPVKAGRRFGGYT
jgi:hypothetical protein